MEALPVARSRIPHRLTGLPLLSCALLWAAPAPAEGIIKRPGMHPDYAVEVEPHLTFAHSNPGPRWLDDGIGPGVRFSIPVIAQGPIPKLNNNMTIGCGIDWTLHDGPCANGFDCDVNVFWFPVVAQWNFFLTDVISVFGEPGLVLSHARWEADYCVGANCEVDRTDSDLDPTFSAGGRFLFSDSTSAVIRLGWPYVSFGLGFLL